MACLFFVVDVLIWCLSQRISVKKAFFIKKWEIWELFILLFCFFYSNLGLPSATSLQKGRVSFLLSRQINKPVTTHKMACHLMDMNIIFQENMCLTDLNHFKHSKLTIFWLHFNTEKNRHCINFSGVQPIVVTPDLCVRIFKTSINALHNFPVLFHQYLQFLLISTNCGEFCVNYMYVLLASLVRCA